MKIVTYFKLILVIAVYRKQNVNFHNVLYVTSNKAPTLFSYISHTSNHKMTTNWLFYSTNRNIFQHNSTLFQFSVFVRKYLNMCSLQQVHECFTVSRRVTIHRKTSGLTRAVVMKYEPSLFKCGTIACSQPASQSS